MQLEHSRRPARVRRAFAAALAWSLCAAAEGPAPGPPRPASRCDVSASSAGADPAELYRQFECRFLRGDYHGCLPFLQRACTLTESPRCAFNLGAVHHALMHCELARSYYQRYLELAPYDDNREAARSALAELALSCGTLPVTSGSSAEPPEESAAEGASVFPPFGSSSAEPAAAPGVAPPPLEPLANTLTGDPLPAGDTAASPRPFAHSLGWWLLGAGAASGAVSVVALLHGARSERDASARDRENGALGLVNDAELRAIDRTGRRSNRLAWGFGGASALLLGAGSTLLLLDWDDGASLSVEPDTAWLRYSGSF